jgi:hypothetical protein
MARHEGRSLAFVFALGALALAGCHKKPHHDAPLATATADGAWPLKLALAADRTGEARIRFELIEDGEARPVVDMRLPWKLVKPMGDGTVQVRLGPPTFPGATTPPPWPAGSSAIFQLDPLDHDSRWKTEVAADAPFGAKVILEKALLVRYTTGAGIVAFPTAPVRVGESWNVDEPPAGGVHTHRQSRLVSCDGRRARVAIAEDSTVDDSPASEHVKGELDYALDQPLPVGGWLRIESRLADGHQRTLAYLFGGR